MALPFVDKLNTKLTSLNPRERSLVMGGGTALLIVIFYLLALAPFYKAVGDRTMRIERKQQDLVWMRGVSSELQAAASLPGNTSNNESLVVLIDRTAHETGLGSAVTGQTPDGDHGIRVRLEAAPFDTVILWLGALQAQQGITVESASIDRAGKSGLVNASLVLTRGSH